MTHTVNDNGGLARAISNGLLRFQFSNTSVMAAMKTGPAPKDLSRSALRGCPDIFAYMQGDRKLPQIERSSFNHGRHWAW
ncbi:hypothetical protein SAMN05518849_114115 [Sphingobium sp. AP50]|nr:hypothetical protein SAMN05518849_114115 [Sphingobium sp. AP50]